MRGSFRSRPKRYALGLAIGSLLVGMTVMADSPPDVAFSAGEDDVGFLHIPLHRGDIAPFELTVIATPNNCETHPDLDLSWDKAKNIVDVHIRGKGALPYFPNVYRTEGVDWFPNPFVHEPKDIIGGRHQFWVITAGPDVTFYYDPGTLNLMGSQYDFATAPPAIPIQLPSLLALGSPFYEPLPNGDVDFEYTIPYDHMVRGDAPDYSHLVVSFPPPNLCQVNPFRIDLSNLRPYVSPAQPASAALSFDQYLRGGLVFDWTVEPAQYFVLPPSVSFVATWSNITLLGGGIPKNWAFDIEAAFMNVAPPIRPWGGAGSCTNYFQDHQRTNNFCTGGAP
jgi:hypothetical protein